MPKMPSDRPNTLKEHLRKAGVREFDDLIHDQPKEWLIQNFSAGATDYPVNVTRLIRNIIWQTRERIRKQQREPMEELIRTFWYTHIKPTLARAGALSTKTDQYQELISQLVFLVKGLRAMRYKDIGFRNDNAATHKVGGHANIILFAEKSGAWRFLERMNEQYQISVIAFGGQPSLLSIEYFTDELRQANVNLRRSFYLFSVVDYDSSGWIVRNSFVKDLAVYGISHTRVVDLVTPDMLTPEEIMLSRFRIPASKSSRTKNKRWLKEIRKRRYKNQHLLEHKTEFGRTTLYGLEGESISQKRLESELDKRLSPILGKTEDLLKDYELRKLDDLLEKLILFKFGITR